MNKYKDKDIEGVTFLIVVGVLGILFGGTPDLMDALISYIGTCEP